MNDTQSPALMAERYAQEKLDEARARDTRLAFLHSVSKFILWVFVAVSILSFIIGCIAGIVLLIKKLL